MCRAAALFTDYSSYMQDVLWQIASRLCMTHTGEELLLMMETSDKLVEALLLLECSPNSQVPHLTRGTSFKQQQADKDEEDENRLHWLEATSPSPMHEEESAGSQQTAAPGGTLTSASVCYTLGS